MSNHGQRATAFDLYCKGYNQKLIAKRLSKSETTISKWATEDNWKTRKKGLLSSKNSLIEGMLDELEEYKKMIQAKEGFKVSNSKEADARRKIIKDLKDLESEYSIGETIQIGQDFVAFAGDIEPEIAIQIMELYDAFVNHVIERKKWQK